MNKKHIATQPVVSRRTFLRNSSCLVLTTLTSSCVTMDVIQKNIEMYRGGNSAYGRQRINSSSRDEIYTRIAIDRITKAGKLTEAYAGMPRSNWRKAMQLYAANFDQNILNAQPDLWGLSKLYWAELMLEENIEFKIRNLQNIRRALHDAESALSVDARNKLGTLLPNSALNAALLGKDLDEASRWLKAGQKYRNRGLTDTSAHKALYREDLIEFYSLAAHTAALQSDPVEMWSWIESSQVYSRNAAFYTNTNVKISPSYVEQNLQKSLEVVDVVLGITVSSAGSSIIATSKRDGKLVSEITQVTTPDGMSFDRHSLERLLYGSTFNEVFSKSGMSGWMGAYAATDNTGTMSTSNTFLQNVRKLSMDHWDYFVGAIKGVLDKLSVDSKSKIALIIPDKMSFLPLRAARNSHNGMTLLDYYSILQIPSVQVLKDSLSREYKQDKSILGLYNPTGDLKNSLLEKYFISNSLNIGNKVELKSGLTAETFMRQLQKNNPQYIYLSTHGAAFNSSKHGVLLGNGNLLTAHDVRKVRGKLNTELVVISACEVAAGSFGLDPEASNLATAFLGKGAKGVISCLWRVEVNATALLMSKFMDRYVNDGVAPALALTEAQQWLRGGTIDQLSSYLTDLLFSNKYPPSDVGAIKEILVSLSDNQDKGSSKPFENPYYWGAFIYLGS